MKTAKTATGTAASPKDFVERSSLRAVLAIGRDYLVIVGAAALSIQLDHWVAYVASVWFIGLIMLGLGETLAHEASHFNLFRNRSWNEWGQVFYTLPFFFVLDDYRREHAEHHKFLNTEQEKLHEHYVSYGLFGARRNTFLIWFLKPLIGYCAFSYVRWVLELGNWRSYLKVLAFWAVVAAGFWAAGGLLYLVLYWLVPLFVCFTTFLYWSEIEDHYNTVTGTRTNIGWANYLTHNNGYHYVHHKYPTIPWYNLKRAHFLLCPENTDISHGWIDTFRQISTPLKKAPEGPPKGMAALTEQRPAGRAA